MSIKHESLRACLEHLQQRKQCNFKLIYNTSDYCQYFFNRRTKWSLQYSTQQQVIDAGFRFKSTKTNPEGTHCYTCDIHVIDWDKSDESYETHLRLSSDCAWLKANHEELMKTRKHAYRRCSVKFASNIKLHQHVQEHHIKKSEKQSKTSLTNVSQSLFFFSIFATEIASTKSTTSILSSFIISCVETTSIESTTPTKPTAISVAIPPPTSLATSSATSNISLSWAAIVAKSMPSTPSPTPSTKSSKSSISKSQKRVKTYLTIDDLHRMFAEKPRRTCLPIIQTRTFSRSSPSSPSSFMSHMRLKSTTQMRITSYFKSAREMSEQIIFSPRKADLIPRLSQQPPTFKCAPNSTAQRYVSNLSLIHVKNVSLSPHISLLSTPLYCRLKRHSSRLRCMSN